MFMVKFGSITKRKRIREMMENEATEVSMSTKIKVLHPILKCLVFIQRVRRRQERVKQENIKNTFSYIRKNDQSI